jgi:hypothetical protein
LWHKKDKLCLPRYVAQLPHSRIEGIFEPVPPNMPTDTAAL